MSNKLILEASNLAQWHTLVREAEKESGCHVDEVMESYLVFTLMRFMKNQNLCANAMAPDFLNLHNLPEAVRTEQLRNIGDQCLLLSGLFPKRAEKRLVRVSYYVDMGRSAYHHLSSTAQHATANLYKQLADAFVVLMDLLQTIRRFSSPVLPPMQSYELWSDTGSVSLFNQLEAGSFPIHESLVNFKTKQ